MNSVIYPKSKDDILKKYEYYLFNEQSPERIKDVKKWMDWYKDVEKYIDYECSDNEFFKWHIDGNKYALQVWKHNNYNNVDEILFNVISNYVDVYCNDNTIVMN